METFAKNKTLVQSIAGLPVTPVQDLGHVNPASRRGIAILPSMQYGIPWTCDLVSRDHF